MPTLEGLDHVLDKHHRQRHDAVNKCALAAYKRGYQVFALQDGGYCTSSQDGIFAYYKYGESDDCFGNGKGGKEALRVYQFKPGKYFTSFT